MSSIPSDSPLILYGTETGTARDCAENFVETLRLCNLHPRLFSFDDFVFEDLQQEKVVLFIVSTSGQGQIPSNMRKGWRQMLSKTLQKDFFANTHFAIAALGDSSYTEYNFAGKKLYRRILSLCGKEIIKLALCDDQHPNGMDEGFENFKKDCILELCTKLKDIFPSIEPLDETKQLPPKFIIRYVDEMKNSTETEDIERGETKHTSHGEKEFVKMRVIKNERVTHIDHFQDTRLITFENFTEDYNPGDVAQLQPENYEEVIQMALEALEIKDEILDRPFHIEKSDSYCLLPPSHILTYPTTLRICFKKLFDINSIPTRAFFQSLSRIATNEMEKERLQELGNYNSLDDFIEYVRLPRRSIAEVLRDFPSTSKEIPTERLFDIMPSIRPRSFSIASSRKMHSKSLQILVARVEYGRKNMRTKKLGLCSNYMAKLSEADEVLIRIQEGTMNFEMHGMTKVCIATGTGIAPFRSLISESHIKDDQDSDPIVLFFGCRGKTKDFYFCEEWPKFANCIIQTAFSRDQDNKVYVHHVMQDNVQLLGRLIKQNKVVFYVAGSSGQMPKDIRSALTSIIEASGVAEEGKQFVAEMEIKKLLQFETWF